MPTNNWLRDDRLAGLQLLGKKDGNYGNAGAIYWLYSSNATSHGEVAMSVRYGWRLKCARVCVRMCVCVCVCVCVYLGQCLPLCPNKNRSEVLDVELLHGDLINLGEPDEHARQHNRGRHKQQRGESAKQ